MQRILLYLLLMIPALITAQTENKNVFSLSECISAALKNNPGVQELQIKSEISKIAVGQAKANLLPNINAGYTSGINQGRSIDPFTNTYINQQYSFASPYMTGNIPVFNGFALMNTIKRNTYNDHANHLAVQQYKDELTILVILTYLDVLTNKELLALANTQKENTKKQVTRLLILKEQEVISPGEYYDLKGAYANDEMIYINASNNLEITKLSLARLLNIPYKKSIELQPIDNTDLLSIDNITVDEIYENALESLTIVKIADTRKKSSDIQVKINKAGLYPSIVLNAGVYSNYSGAANIKYKQQIDNNLNTTINAGLNIPLFNSLRARNAVRISKLEQKYANTETNTSRIRLRHLIEEAYINMQFAKDKYNVSIQQVNYFSESYKRAEIRFNAGAGSVVDYIIAKNNYDKSNINLINTRYDYLFRIKILKYIRGEMNL